MMYLSKVSVASQGLDQRAFYQLLRGNAYGNHQLLWKLFPDEKERPFLFRQELERGGEAVSTQPRGLPLFYLLSDSDPNPVQDLLSVETKPFDPQLNTGQRLVFRLRANPVISRREEGRKNSRRHDVLMDAKRTAKRQGASASEIQEGMDAAAAGWLSESDRASAHGYRLLVEPRISGYRQHAHRRKGGEIRFSSVDYEGLLEVIDVPRFKRSLMAGIGRSRAFGCGMWLIRRAPR